MSESSEAVGGGTAASASAAAPEVSAAAVPVEEGGGGTLLDDAPLVRGGATLNWAALWRRKVAPMGAITWTGSPDGKPSRPK